VHAGVNHITAVVHLYQRALCTVARDFDKKVAAYSIYQFSKDKFSMLSPCLSPFLEETPYSWLEHAFDLEKTS